LALEAVRSAAHPNLVPAVEPEAECRLNMELGRLAAEQRHCGRLGEARKTADRMLALGHLLVSRHRDHPAGHLALSDAYTQLYKNAYQTDDMAAVERNMRLSLDAALRAQALDPYDELVRARVVRRQRGLNDLQNPK
jgi:hypothetical protein